MVGPDVQLGPEEALATGLAIHELATNALKYGAFSAPDGVVNIVWRLENGEGRDELVLDWIELNGPPVQAPRRRGFGTTLIERSFAHQLSGKATLNFELDGVRATLRAPIGAVVSAGPNPEKAA
jgi:two-component sensor histidine kinase